MPNYCVYFQAITQHNSSVGHLTKVQQNNTDDTTSRDMDMDMVSMTQHQGTLTLIWFVWHNT